MYNRIKNKIYNMSLRKRKILVYGNSVLDINENVIGDDFLHCPRIETSVLGGNIRLSEGCVIRYSRIYGGGGGVELGRFTDVAGPGVFISCFINKISIGAFVSIGQNVAIYESNHKTDRIANYCVNTVIFDGEEKNDMISKGEINIEEDVWLGAGVTVLSGVTVGRGSVIGAGSVVSKDIPSYSIAVGNPAKKIKKRFNDEKIAEIEEMRWWEWDINKLRAKKHLFL